DGEVTAVDIDLGSLEELQRKADQEGLSDRIRIRLSTLTDLEFPEGYFDIIWSEGSIFVIGFEQGLVQWKPFLKQEGFLVIHEMVWLKPEPPEEIRTYWENIYPGICDIDSCLHTIKTSGYRLIGHFHLPEDLWWREYYEPLQMHIYELRQKYAENTAILKMLDKEQHEIDLYRKYRSWYGSAFFVIQKHASTP
ncbi:MAG: SAM-dependent methyltransferase, partial [Desulfomonilia bacterium]